MDHQQNPELEKQLFYALCEEEVSVTIDSLLEKLHINEQCFHQTLNSLIAKGMNVDVVNRSIKVNAEAINTQLLEDTLKSKLINKKLHYQYQIESTNNLVNQTQSIGLTEFQTNGYGRQNKAWLSPIAHGLPISINHEFHLPIAKLTGLSLAVGAALVQLLNQYSSEEFKIKWPNDVYGKQGKVAGILIHASSINKQKTQMIIGIGINWNLSTKQLNQMQYPCMNANIGSITKSEFISKLIIRLENCFADFEKYGLKTIINQWQNMDYLANKPVQIIDNNKTFQGQYLGINQSGAIKVKINDQIKEFVNGEVSVRKVDI